MKLIRLKLHTPFRSLPEGFTVNFLHEKDKKKAYEFNPYCLAGRNGGGKSNILEALAAIFYHLECMYLGSKPDGFDKDEEHPNGFDATVGSPNAYELEYFIPKPIDLVTDKPVAVLPDNLIKIIINKELGSRPIVHWQLSGWSEDFEFAELNRSEVKQLLPKYIIGYSSGENEILSLPFLKMRFIHFDEYKERLIDKKGYSKPEARFIYADNSYSQAIFLTNYLMQDEGVLEPFLEVLGIENLEQFRIVIKNKEVINYDIQTGEVYNRWEFIRQTVLDEDDKSKGFQKLNLLELIKNSVFTKLIACSTCNYEDEESESFLLDYLLNEETKKAFRFHFEDNPIELFQAFQILLTLNLFEVSTKIKSKVYQSDSLFANDMIPVLANNKKIMRFEDLQITKKSVGKLLTKSLSDGEHQYLHAIGLCLLFKNTNSLFLLDEPETHLNPDWRSSFISVLRDSLTGKQSNEFGASQSSSRDYDGDRYSKDDNGKEHTRELLITSHSPFIISDCKRENVLVFTKDDETNKVVCNRPDFKTFGASVNQITIKVFGQQDTIGDYAKSKLDDFHQRLDKGEKPEQLIDEANDLLGDSVEKIMFINKALDQL